MYTPLGTVTQLDAPLVLGKLAELRITSVEQLLPRIMLARRRNHLEEFVGVSLDGIVEQLETAIPAGITSHRAATGALIPAGLGPAGAVISGSAGGGAGGSGGNFPPVPQWLPPRCDLSQGFTLPVRDQGDRLTCVAFSTCAAAEFVEHASAPWGPQHLYWRCKSLDAAPWDKVCGTFVDTAIRALTSGVCEESDWIYSTRKQQCPDHHGPPPSHINQRIPAVQGKMLANSDLVAIKEAVFNGHPVVASIRCFDWWLKTDFGTGNITSPVPGDWSTDAHAICIVGYEDLPDGSGDGNLLFRNSWGTTFGATATGGWRDGHGRIGYRYIVGYPGGAPFSVELAEIS